VNLSFLDSKHEGQNQKNYEQENQELQQDENNKNLQMFYVNDIISQESASLGSNRSISESITLGITFIKNSY
jgi:hypothetical protein